MTRTEERTCTLQRRHYFLCISVPYSIAVRVRVPKREHAVRVRVRMCMVAVRVVVVMVMVVFTFVLVLVMCWLRSFLALGLGGMRSPGGQRRHVGGLQCR